MESRANLATRVKRALWVLAAIAATLVYAWPVIECFRATTLRDFVQEWASARNFQTGRPVYEPLETSLARHFGYRRQPGEIFLERNVHPPTSILLAIPLAEMSYPSAFLVWNLISLFGLAASLYLTARGLGIALTAWSVWPIYTLLVICNPLHQQIFQGQLNLVLLVLIIGTWWADRNDRPGWAGVFLGAATVIKLFPGFLFLYFIFQRRWRAIASGAATIVVLTLLTTMLLGSASYRDYVVDVLPTLGSWRSSWSNASLLGFWSKLLDPNVSGSATAPLVRRPMLAFACTGVSVLLVLATVAVVIRKASTRTDRDHAFAVCLSAMLLVTPIVWDHAFLLLLLPIALLWKSLPPSGPLRWWFRFCLVIVWVKAAFWWTIFLSTGRVKGMRPTVATWQILTGVSLQTYALIGLFVLGIVAARAGDVLSPIAEKPKMVGRRRQRR
jgi:hypothetical protein